MFLTTSSNYLMKKKNSPRVALTLKYDIICQLRKFAVVNSLLKWLTLRLNNSAVWDLNKKTKTVPNSPHISLSTQKVSSKSEIFKFWPPPSPSILGVFGGLGGSRRNFFTKLGGSIFFAKKWKSMKKKWKKSPFYILFCPFCLLGSYGVQCTGSSWDIPPGQMGLRVWRLG